MLAISKIIIFRLTGLGSLHALNLVYSFAFRFNPDFLLYVYFDLNYFLVLIARLVLCFITY